MNSIQRKDDFPQLKDTVYLDHTGATLPSSSQLDGFYRDMRENLYGNPHSRSSSSSLCTETIDQTRFRILRHFNTTLEKHTVIFTSGCTGALRLLAESFDWSGFNSYDQKLDKSLKHHDGKENGQQQRGMFSYLQDNHTSVVGMREIARSKNASSKCLTKDTIERLCSTSASLLNDVNTQSDMTKRTVDNTDCKLLPNGLFAYPAQSNFCGHKYPLCWAKKVQDGMLHQHTGCHGNWYVVLDAAALVSTSPLDLSQCDADFVTISFYKMFGFPTGLGALIVRNDSADVLVREYFGGGTVMAYLVKERFNKQRTEIAERFEDGTLPFLDIVSLRHGFDVVETLGGGMKSISEHTFLLAEYVYKQLSSWKHSNGRAVCEMYNQTQFDSLDNQGPIVNFNLLLSNGEHAGYAEFERLASLHDIHLRTGCFCNTGACQSYLNISDQDIKDNLDAGHVCGDDMDLIEGRPTGSVRISFGYMSNQEDADRFLRFVGNCFVDRDCTTEKDAEESTNTLLPAEKGRLEHSVEASSLSSSSSSSQSSLPSCSTIVGDDKCQSVPPSIPTSTSSTSSSSIDSSSAKVSSIPTLTTLSMSQPPSRLDPSASKVSIQTSTSSSQLEPRLSSDPSSEESSIPASMSSSLSQPPSNLDSSSSKASSILMSKTLLHPPSSLDPSSVRISSITTSSSSSKVSSSTIPVSTSSLMQPPRTLDPSSGPKSSTSLSDETNVSSIDARMSSISLGQRTIHEPLPYDAPKLSGIYLYPVKSCGAMEVSEWELSEAGLKYDRRWMIVNDGGVYMSQKRIPHLCLIKPAIDLVNQQLILKYADKQPFILPLDIPRSYINETSLCSGKVCGDRVNTIDCGDEVAAWLTEVIGQRCRLQQQDPDYHRASKLNKNSAKRASNCSLSLANRSQYLLVTASSSASLLSAVQQATRQEGNSLSTEDMISRFRSNLVVEGCGAFDEESWSKIAIGSQDFEVKGCCNRCQMICINQDTAEKGTEPLFTLSAVRSKKIFFGVHLMNGPNLKGGVKIRKGDLVRVLERSTSSETTV